MAAYPPPYSPRPPYGQREQARVLREQARTARQAVRAQQQLFRDQYRASQRRSVLGPLLVFTLGVVFLLGRLGHLDPKTALLWYGRWWPGLLVGAGLILLAEWGWDERSARRAAPERVQHVRRGIGGGVIFLLIVCGVAGSLIQGLTHAGNTLLHRAFVDDSSLSNFFGERHEQDQAYDLALPPSTDIIIDNPNGNIVFAGTSTDGQVHVLEHKRIYGSSAEETARRLSALALHPEIAAGALRISVPSLEGGVTDLSITAPPAARTSLSANHGEVRASGLRAAVRIVANDGNVTLSSVTGGVSVELNGRDCSIAAHDIHGDLALSGTGQDVTLANLSGAVSLDGDFYGDTHLEHLAGPTRFQTSRTSVSFASLKGAFEISPHADLTGTGVIGPIAVQSYSRNIRLNQAAGDISVNDRNGSVDIEALTPAANVDIENENGSVAVTLPAAVSALLRANARDGDIEDQFPPQPTKAGPVSSLEGKLGSGAGRVIVQTSDASIKIHKSGKL